MDPAEIEHLISEAIGHRPKATSAPLNLYIHNNKLVCGARIVMPRGADFVAHVPPDWLENGFGEKEWKLIVEKIRQIVKIEKLDGNGEHRLTTVARQNSQNRSKDNQRKFEDRRREERLHYRCPIRFARDFNEKFSQGQLRDVSSGGMAFTCRVNESCLEKGQQIAARFSVPRFNPDYSYDMVSFDRTGSIRRVDKINKSLCRIAIQFADPLPFKPAEQENSQVSRGQLEVAIL